jgi:hypothetical protein
VLNYVPQTAGIEGDDGRLAEESLDRDQSEALIGGGNDQRSSALIEAGQICLGNLSMPADSRPELELPSKSLE